MTTIEEVWRQEYDENVTNLTWLQQQDMILFGVGRETVIALDPMTGQEQFTINHPLPPRRQTTPPPFDVPQLTWNHDQTRLIIAFNMRRWSSDAWVMLVDTANGNVLQEVDKVDRIERNAETNHVVVYSPTTFHVIDVETGEILTTEDLPDSTSATLNLTEDQLKTLDGRIMQIWPVPLNLGTDSTSDKTFAKS
jgi:glucose dehydrogenase